MLLYRYGSAHQTTFLTHCFNFQLSFKTANSMEFTSIHLERGLYSGGLQPDVYFCSQEDGLSLGGGGLTNWGTITGGRVISGGTYNWGL